MAIIASVKPEETPLGGKKKQTSQDRPAPLYEPNHQEPAHYPNG